MYYEANDDEVFEWYEKYYKVSTEDVLFGDTYKLPHISNIVAESIIDRMCKDESFIELYDTGDIEDLDEFIKKYPERAKILCEKYIPKNANELYSLIDKKYWDLLIEEFYKDYNNRGE